MTIESEIPAETRKANRFGLVLGAIDGAIVTGLNFAATATAAFVITSFGYETAHLLQSGSGAQAIGAGAALLVTAGLGTFNAMESMSAAPKFFGLRRNAPTPP